MVYAFSLPGENEGTRKDRKSLRGFLFLSAIAIERPAVARPVSEIEQKLKRINDERDCLLKEPGTTPDRLRRMAVLSQRALALSWVLNRGWLI